MMKRCAYFLLGAMASLLALAWSSGLSYRGLVPVWRQVEVDWSYPSTKVAFLGDTVRSASYVILGDSVALRGLDAGCLSAALAPAVNLGLSSADAASFLGTAAAVRRAGAPVHQQNAIVVAYADMFGHWSTQDAETRTRLPVPFRGLQILMQSGGSTWLQALRRFQLHVTDSTWCRVFLRPLQVSALRETILGKVEEPADAPARFIEEPSGLCPCDREILPYHRQAWWVESHYCASGSEPSFPIRTRTDDYPFWRRNDPVGIPNEYPYSALVEVLENLGGTFGTVTLVVFPDRYGLSDPLSFDQAMKAVADQAGAGIVLLTDLDVADMFYDEHHALPSGMQTVTQELAVRLSESLRQGP